MLQCTAEELLVRFFGDRTGPEMAGRTLGTDTVIDELTEEHVVFRTPVGSESLRPGGMMSGPALVGVVDVAGWMVTVAHNPPGMEGLTTDISVQFLRSTSASEVVVTGRPLKIGRRCIVDVEVRAADVDGPVVHAVVTFAPVKLDVGT